MRIFNKNINELTLGLILFIFFLLFYIYLLSTAIGESNKYANQLALEISRLRRSAAESAKSNSLPKSDSANAALSPIELNLVRYTNFSYNNFVDEHNVKYPNSIQNNYEQIKCKSYVIDHDAIRKGIVDKMLLGYEEEFYYEDTVITDYLINNNGDSMENITHCKANDEDIIYFDIPSGGGGVGNKVYVGYLGGLLIEIPNKSPYGGPYWSC